MTPPASRMGPADHIGGKAQASPLWAKYGKRVDNESAREILAARMAPSAKAASPRDGDADAHVRQAPADEHKQAASAMSGGVAAVSAFLQSKEGKKLQKEVVRGAFGLLKKRL